MADLTVTAASVLPYSGAIQETGVAGEAIATAGLALYKKSGDKRWYKSDNDNAEADAIAHGVSLCAAPAAGLPVVVHTEGDLNPGATLTVGTSYYVGAAAGGIAPGADVTAGKYPRFLGMAVTASKLRVRPMNPAVAQA